jgi:pimeloyl-ACP methyl ester carboxylesterase
MVTNLISTLHWQPFDRFVDVNGLRIQYLDWGETDKQPLIMLHGIGRVPLTFDYVAPHFEDNDHVTAIDMRGHSNSGWDPHGAYLVENYAKDIEGLVAELRLRNIVHLGKFDRGPRVRVFAGLHPELIAAVIVEDVGPERPREIVDSVTTRIERGTLI